MFMNVRFLSWTQLKIVKKKVKSDYMWVIINIYIKNHFNVGICAVEYTPVVFQNKLYML